MDGLRQNTRRELGSGAEGGVKPRPAATLGPNRSWRWQNPKARLHRRNWWRRCASGLSRGGW